MERLPEILPQTAEALRKLKLPGITLNLSERAVDVNATVCLREGLLELVARHARKQGTRIDCVDCGPADSHPHSAAAFRCPARDAGIAHGARDEGGSLDSRETGGDAIQVSLVFPDTDKPQEHPIVVVCIAFAQPKKVEGLPQPKIASVRFPTVPPLVRIWSMTVPIPKNICANKAATSSPSPPSR